VETKCDLCQRPRIHKNLCGVHIKGHAVGSNT
jgi:hypothetical protein